MKPEMAATQMLNRVVHVIGSGPITIPNKAKYRLPGGLFHRDKVDPPEGTWLYRAGKYHSRNRTNAASAKSKAASKRPPMHAYWGNVLRG